MTQATLERPSQQFTDEKPGATPRALVGEMQPRGKELPPLTMETIELDDLEIVPDVVW